MLKDFQVNKNGSYISLVKLSGCKITDAFGYVSKEFGDPLFKISSLLLEDENGNEHQITVDGEHDFAYLYNHSAIPHLDEDFLESLYQEEYPDEEEATEEDDEPETTIHDEYDDLF